MSLVCRSSRFVGLVGHRARRARQWLAGCAAGVLCAAAATPAAQHVTSAPGLLPYKPARLAPVLAPSRPAVRSVARPAIPTAVGFTSIAGSKAVRWNETTDRVIRIRVEDAPTLDGWDRADTAIIRRAFEAWERRGTPVHFVLDSSADADVVIHWVDHFDGAMSGWTTVNWDDRGEIHHGDVRLALRTPTGRRLSPAERLLLATHEFGHVLGLGHMSDTSSIMSAVIYAHEIGARDIQSIQRLYTYTVASR